MRPPADGYEPIHRKLIVLRARKLRLGAQLRGLTADRQLWSLLSAIRAIRQRQEDERARAR